MSNYWNTKNIINETESYYYAISGTISSLNIKSFINYSISNVEYEKIMIVLINLEPNAIVNNKFNPFNYYCKCIFDGKLMKEVSFITGFKDKTIFLQVSPEFVNVFRMKIMNCKSLTMIIELYNGKELILDYILKNSNNAISMAMNEFNSNFYSQKNSQWDLRTIRDKTSTEIIESSVIFKNNGFDNPKFMYARRLSNENFVISFENIPQLDFTSKTDHIIQESDFKITIDNEPTFTVGFHRITKYSTWKITKYSNIKYLLSKIKYGNKLLIEGTDSLGTYFKYEYPLKDFINLINTTKILLVNSFIDK